MADVFDTETVVELLKARERLEREHSEVGLRIQIFLDAVMGAPCLVFDIRALLPVGETKVNWHTLVTEVNAFHEGLAPRHLVVSLETSVNKIVNIGGRKSAQSNDH